MPTNVDIRQRLRKMSSPAPPPHRSYVVVQPPASVALGVVDPVFADFDVEAQVDALFQDGFQLLAGGGADRLDHAAALAQHDPLLAVALDIDHLRDAHAAVLERFPGLGLHGHAVGQLLAQPQEQLFARDLRRHQPHRHVGELVLGIEPRPRRHPRGQGRAQIRDAVAGGRRDHVGVGERELIVERGAQAQQRAALHQVDLGQRQHGRPPGARQPVQELRPVARAAGETAPLIFTALFSQYWLEGLWEPTASLSVLVYNFATVPYEGQQRLAWAAALILVAIVLLTSILSRWATRKQIY